MRASTAWLIAAAVILSGVSGCSGLSWSSAPKMPGSSTLSKLNPMNLFKKKKPAEQYADNGRPTLPAASDAARGSVPRVGGPAPTFGPPVVNYSNSAERSYPSTRADAYGGYRTGNGTGGGGSFAGPSGGGDLYRQDRTYLDDYPSSNRGGSLAGGDLSNFDNRRGGTDYARSGGYYGREEEPVRTADGRNGTNWNVNSGVQMNNTGYPLSPTPRDVRSGSSFREAPRTESYGEPYPSAGEPHRWSGDNYNSGSQPRRDEPNVDDRFGKGGNSYGGMPTTVDTTRRTGSSFVDRAGSRDPGLIRPVPNRSRYGDVGTSGRSTWADSSRFDNIGQYGNAPQYGSDAGAKPADRLATYRQDTAGNYTPGSTGFGSVAAAIRQSPSAVVLTGGVDRSSSGIAPTNDGYRRDSYTQSRSGGANGYQTPSGSGTRDWRRDAD